MKPWITSVAFVATVLVVVGLCTGVGYKLSKDFGPEYYEEHMFTGTVVKVSSCGHATGYEVLDVKHYTLPNGVAMVVPAVVAAHNHYYRTTLNINGNDYEYRNKALFAVCENHVGDTLDVNFKFGYRDGKCVSEDILWVEFH